MSSTVQNTEYILGQSGNRGRVSALSAGAYITTLFVIVDIVKGGGRAPPSSPVWANYSIMMECSPESGCCHSVYSVVQNLTQVKARIIVHCLYKWHREHHRESMGNLEYWSRMSWIMIWRVQVLFPSSSIQQWLTSQLPLPKQTALASFHHLTNHGPPPLSSF
jgi:hypothetical protein